MKTTMTKQVAVEAKTLNIHIKVSDRFCGKILNWKVPTTEQMHEFLKAEDDE
jgi:hypothetical protein